MSIEMVHLSERTPAECYVYQYLATWVLIVKKIKAPSEWMPLSVCSI